MEFIYRFIQVIKETWKEIICINYTGYLNAKNVSTLPLLSFGTVFGQFLGHNLIFIFRLLPTTHCSCVRYIWNKTFLELKRF